MQIAEDRFWTFFEDSLWGRASAWEANSNKATDATRNNFKSRMLNFLFTLSIINNLDCDLISHL